MHQAFDLQCFKFGFAIIHQKWSKVRLATPLKELFSEQKNGVKWHGLVSEMRYLNGAGPQGILEFLSQTNNNLNFVDEDPVHIIVDDASVLEVVNLLSIVLASHNFKQHVAANIPTHKQFIPADDLQSKKYL